MSDYHSYLSRKFRSHQPTGFDADISGYDLFPHQSALTQWALRKGRAAIFADTGLGKMRMELVWADQVCQHTGGNVLMLAPLAVAEQIVEEGRRIGVTVTHARDGADIRPGVNIANYERLHRFSPSAFSGIVLDESSRIKHDDSKTLATLLEFASAIDYRLPASATPAPNDWTELGTHAEFLGICTKQEMLAEFFVHDGGETQVWRLKGHARADFWRWVSSWAALVRSPADLGFDASAYELPPLNVQQITVESDGTGTGDLFMKPAQTLMERRQARKASINQRVAAVAEMVNGSTDPWVIWCELNAEGDALRKAIPDAVEVRGSDTADEKERRLLAFSHGETRVMLSKPKIAGWGLNWQHCRNIAFVGVTDSFEGYYQAVRRCWRFGQTKPVNVYLFASAEEGAVRANLERKESEARAMAEALSTETAASVRNEVLGQRRVTNTYDATQRVNVPAWLKVAA
jgi:hypothetical protein